MRRTHLLPIAAALGLSLALTMQVGARETPPTITLSIVGTNDLHGYVFPSGGRGGLALLGGYMKALRAARAADRGAVLLLDGGDTFQGGIESNLSEGALVVDAYNALGYTAAAIGNHEFDFGHLDAFKPSAHPDPRGALKAIAARSRYPVLAANLIDASTGRPVEWPNVSPSVIVDAAGLRIGIIGAMTIDALRSTLAVNIQGLRVSPLAPVIAAEAAALRERGADLVVLTTHAGGRCTRFDDPHDLTSCDGSSEIVRLVHDLPPGALDAIVAGHTHAGMAQIVDGVPIIEALWGGRAFGRMDLTVNRATKKVTAVRMFPPQDLCATVNAARDACAAETSPGAVKAQYEQQTIEPDQGILRAMEPALHRVHARQAVPLEVTVDTTIRRGPDVGAPLGNLFADAMRESLPGADVALSNNGLGGLRADLSIGPLTFGRLYDVFPFDNRVARLTISGAELRTVVTAEVARDRPGAIAVSGMSVSVRCEPEGPRVWLARSSGEAIRDDERLQVVTSDMLAAGVVFASVAPPGGFAVPTDAPLVREVIQDWLQRRGGHLMEAEFLDPARPRWPLTPCRN